MMNVDVATQHPWITAVGAFLRYPRVGTIEHLRNEIRASGLRWFDAVAVEYEMRHEVPEDLTDCEKCGGGDAHRGSL